MTPATIGRDLLGVAVLGSTGSIGVSTLRVIDRHRDAYRVVALVGGSNHDLLTEQVAAWRPLMSGLVHGNGNSSFARGASTLVDAATHGDVDIVVNAVVGAAGLDATLAALRAGKRVALANKESMVMAGSLVAEAARVGGGEIVPIDSEHSAVLQCVTVQQTPLSRLILTASGGPFRTWERDRVACATVAEALHHPTWQMGPKISVDSATLANKALEVIEAHFLFGLPFDRIDVVVHPQSVIHSFVEFIDGSVVAQMSVPTMELPVLYALTHPERVADDGVPAFDPVKLSPMTFEPVDHERFPALRLGISAGEAGGAAPAVFNAANECAVAAFLAGKIAFADIPRGIASALEELGGMPAGTREQLLAADSAGRRHVKELFKC